MLQTLPTLSITTVQGGVLDNITTMSFMFRAELSNPLSPKPAVRNLTLEEPWGQGAKASSLAMVSSVVRFPVELVLYVGTNKGNPMKELQRRPYT